jgi:hypothetical protein
VEAAAVALLCGWDPMAYLRARGTERLIADAVLRTANRLRNEEMEHNAKLIGGYVAQAFAGG